MTCNEIKTLLPGYPEGSLSPEEKEYVESHLASCPLCSRILEDFKETDYLVKGLREVEPPPFFEQRIMARVREEAGRKKGLMFMWDRRPRLSFIITAGGGCATISKAKNLFSC